MPENESKKFKGFAFIQFTNVLDAGKVGGGSQAPASQPCLFRIPPVSTFTAELNATLKIYIALRMLIFVLACGPFHRPLAQ